LILENKKINKFTIAKNIKMVYNINIIMSKIK